MSRVLHVAELFAEIVVFGALDKALHYGVPPGLREKVQVGCRVLVPLGSREALGLVIALDSSAPDVPAGVILRPIAAVVDPSPLVDRHLIALCRWVSEYYFYPPGEVLQAALPAEAGTRPRTFLQLTEAGRRQVVQEEELPSPLKLLHRLDRVALEEVVRSSPSRRKALKDIEVLIRSGRVERTFDCSHPQARSKKVKTARLLASPDPGKLGANENLRALVAALDRAAGALPLRDLRQCVHNCDYWIRKLEREGFLEVVEIEELRESRFAQSLPLCDPPRLTSDQQEVLDAILPRIVNPSFRPFLLFGVTGSGKTEIYLRLVEETLRAGRGALVLVPEIALSTQQEALFRQRFGLQLAIWHSGLSPGTRYDQWREVRSGKRKVVLGVRSAVFMPVADPGLIIVDEEHDGSYKQEDRLRYHARDVALVRAQMLDIPIVLGSATPSVQSIYHCRTNRYTRLSIPRRILDRPLPSLHIVDMRMERGSSRILSTALQKALSETLQAGEQALLFLNRRGFATFLLCHRCGHVTQCPNCSVSLTYHQKSNSLRCHYCGSEKRIPDHCPSCSHSPLRPHGFGTERVEEEVRRIFPNASLVRVDRDTVEHSRNVGSLLGAVRDRRANILIGTQMIAKGHDFPHITLVGIINADTALQISDFRAGETTVQLLMQVAGRAGRGDKPGRVIIQTFNPRHYTIRSVLHMDYLEFCEEELASREELQYPPFTRMVKFQVSAILEQEAREAAYQLAALAREAAGLLGAGNRPAAILGPAPAPIPKLKKHYRWQLFVKTWNSQDMRIFIETVLDSSKAFPLLRKVQVSVDRDPVSSF